MLPSSRKQAANSVFACPHSAKPRVEMILHQRVADAHPPEAKPETVHAAPVPAHAPENTPGLRAVILRPYRLTRRKILRDSVQ